jgi:methionyl-tRNA formyltransferase
MRIVFMGTPEFARKSLERLYKNGCDIVGVFTQADKPRNRGMKLSYSPVKELALEFGTPVYQPDKLSFGDFNDIQCDLIVVVAYGKILPKSILDIPPLGCVNIHGSLLPKYRGASPVQYAILNGEKETGVTSQYMSEAMDAGDIISTKTTQIGEDETSADLFERLGSLGAELISETVNAIKLGKATRTPQNHEKATFAPRITKELSPIDWLESAYRIKNRVRALVPWPVATMELGGKTLKVHSVDITGNQTKSAPGTIISQGNQGLEISTSDGTVLIKTLQAPGGKIMSSPDFLRGNPITFGYGV